MSEMSEWTVEYWIASYHGEVVVWADGDSEKEHVIAKAKEQLRRQSGGCSLPFGAQSFKVTRED
jgi:hypothetical protein